MDQVNRKSWRMKRLEKDITLTEIAAAIDCTYNHLSQWEKKEGYQVAAEKIESYMKYIERK